VDANDSLLVADAGVTVIVETAYGIPQLHSWPDSVAEEPHGPYAPDYYFTRPGDGATVAKFVNPPSGTFQIMRANEEMCSPPYSFEGLELLRSHVAGDGWPSPNGFGNPPAAMYVNGRPFGPPIPSIASSPGHYLASFTYLFSANGDQWGWFSREVLVGGDGDPAVSGLVGAHLG
jgi:hypothetical protein